jgi:carbonic anhydrase
MSHPENSLRSTLSYDLRAGVVVFLVALPLCLGIALASNAPLFSGVLSGIVGGIVVGLMSGSHTSVSGPAAGLTAIVAAQIAALGTFEVFLLAVFLGGVIQLVAGLLRGGFIAKFVPTSVIKGLLTAIGVILILKQLPHLVGHDNDPEGEMSFKQPDGHNPFSELLTLLEGQWHLGAAVIGILSVVILVTFDKVKFLKKSPIPAPLIVVVMGVALNELFRRMGAGWFIGSSHLVQVPVAESIGEFTSFLTLPDFSAWNNPAVYIGAITIAVVASLETLLNLEAVDQIDPLRRNSPPSRELVAQGAGNICCGLIGGLPVTSVIVRSSVNVNTGGRTKMSAVIHGFFLLGCVMLVPQILNMIPLSALAGILLVTGFKLASPQMFSRMYAGGRYQFAPYIITVLAIVFTDLLIGILIGLAVALSFILYSNLKRPLHRIQERHVGGDVLRIELPDQVSFLNRAALDDVLSDVPRGGHVLLDARKTDYIDPDVLDMLLDFKQKTGPARGVTVSLRGFRSKYPLDDEIQFVDYSTRELQKQLNADQVMELLQAGNERFRNGRPLPRDHRRQLTATADGQHPLAVVVSCMDSRTPMELVCDVGLGDIFSVRVAGNIITPEVLASIEYGCLIAEAPLVLVMGHTRCGAVTATVEALCETRPAWADNGCAHLGHILDEIGQSIEGDECRGFTRISKEQQRELIDRVALRNVEHSVASILERSSAIAERVQTGEVAVVGALYDVCSGQIEFLHQEAPVTANIG